MKKIIALALALLMLLPLCACSEKKDETKTDEKAAVQGEKAESVDNTTVRLKALTGPTGMGLATLIHNQKAGSGNKANYEIDLVTSPDQITGPVIGNLCDIAAVPINLAAILYQKSGGKIQILCANTLGVLYMVENGNSIKSVSDLKGKTIYAPNPGSTPEYILRYVLKENGIDPDKDVKLEFLAGGDEVAAKLATTKGAIGMLPEPKKSAFLDKNTSFRVCLDMTEEWNKVAGSGNTLIQGVFIARKEFIEQHPQVIKNFLDDYNASQKNVNTSLTAGAKHVVEAKILPSEILAKKAIPGCNITFIEGKEMKAAVEKCLQVLFDADTKSVGGKLPSEDIYYAR
ncbi:MAG: ABC transporter substrate-binding protein [Ruminococcaceae bacterium]|nr:ABC transporter substrate-binding protein [Oscillospiraceae bacterium]